jgi:hypothetical protein
MAVTIPPELGPTEAVRAAPRAGRDRARTRHRCIYGRRARQRTFAQHTLHSRSVGGCARAATLVAQGPRHGDRRPCALGVQAAARPRAAREELGLRPSLTSFARAGGSHLRRVQASVVRRRASHRTCCRAHPSLTNGVALRAEGSLRNASITQSWTQGDTFSPPSCGRDRSRTGCSTSASRSRGALRRERLQQIARRRNFWWCSSPPPLVTS